MKTAITVLGSLHMDFVTRAPRLPLLGETLMGQSCEQFPGGKGLNQAAACARAGWHTQMLGAVGDDVFGDQMIAWLAERDVDVGGIRRLHGERSGMSVAIVEGTGDYAAVVISQANARLDAASVAGWHDRLEASSVLILQNEIAAEVNQAAARFMQSRGRPVVLNAAPARQLSAADLEGVSVLVVNAVEAEMMGAAPVTDLASAEGAGRALAKSLGVDVVVTAGGHGAAWARTDDSHGRVPGAPVKVVSTLGAGDAFIGELTVTLVGGASLHASVEAANAAAALHIGGERHASAR
jgi:ribokinase